MRSGSAAYDTVTRFFITPDNGLCTIPRRDGPHFHTCMELNVFLSGGGVSEVGGVARRFSKGDICVVFPFQPHRNQSDGEGEALSRIAFIDPVDVARRTGCGLSALMDLMRGASAYGVLPRGVSGRLTLFLDMLLDEIDAEVKSGQPPLCRVYALLLLFLEELSKVKTGHAPAALPEKYESMNAMLGGIRDSLRLGVQPTTKQIADANFISESTCRRMFREIIRATPKQYVSAAAIGLARSYLLTTRMSVTEISEKTGFRDITTFNRVFSALVGMPPTAFRKTGGTAH